MTDMRLERSHGHLIRILQDHDGGGHCIDDLMDPCPMIFKTEASSLSFAMRAKDLPDDIPDGTLLEARSQLVDLFDLGEGDTMELTDAALRGDSVADVLRDWTYEHLSENDTDLDFIQGIATALGYITHRSTQRGFCQGDIIEILCVATPEFIKDRFVQTPDAATIEAALKDGADQYGAWAFGEVYEGSLHEMPDHVAEMDDDAFEEFRDELSAWDDLFDEPLDSYLIFEMLPDLDNGEMITSLRQTAQTLSLKEAQNVAA